MKQPNDRPQTHSSPSDFLILVADDDSAILDATSLVLEDEGYRVETSSNGETIGKIKRLQPNLVLLDIWMSGEDGREICAELKQLPETKHIPVIMMSANKDTARLSKECGAEDFLTKPFDINDLLEKVKHYLQ